jgi:hypothetical protein
MGSSDPQFEPKAIGIIGPYLNRPQYAAVFRFDEKTAPQAFLIEHLARCSSSVAKVCVPRVGGRAGKQ